MERNIKASGSSHTLWRIRSFSVWNNIAFTGQWNYIIDLISCSGVQQTISLWISFLQTWQLWQLSHTQTKKTWSIQEAGYKLSRKSKLSTLLKITIRIIKLTKISLWWDKRLSWPPDCNDKYPAWNNTFFILVNLEVQSQVAGRHQPQLSLAYPPAAANGSGCKFVYI